MMMTWFAIFTYVLASVLTVSILSIASLSAENSNDGDMETTIRNADGMDEPWDVEGDYKIVSKSRFDKFFCPVNISYTKSTVNELNSKFEENSKMTVVWHANITEDAASCKGHGAMYSVPIAYLLSKEGKEVGNKRFNLTRRLSKYFFARHPNATASTEVAARKQLLAFKERAGVGSVGPMISFDMYKDSNKHGLPMRVCGNKKYGDRTFWLNLKGGAGNSIQLAAMKNDKVDLPATQHGLILEKPSTGQYCVYKADDQTPEVWPPARTRAPYTTRETAKAGLLGRSTSATSQDKTAADSKEATCFPAKSTVELENGTTKRMDEIIVGDRVLVAPGGLYSEVFGFTHKVSESEASRFFVKLSINNGEYQLSATDGHFVYLNDELKVISGARVGDQVTLGDGRLATITEVSRELSRGLYNPQTLHGDMVVSGVTASTYTRAVDPRIAHGGLTMTRALFRLLGQYISAFENGCSYELSVFLPAATDALP